MKLIKFFFIAALAIGMMACENSSVITNPTDPTNPASIFGLWQEKDNGQLKNEFMRFLKASEEAKDGEYFFGKEWDEDDYVYETDLKYKGNGWFKWKIDGKSMIQIELLDNGSAEVPKTYNLVKLTETELVLQDANDKTDQDTFVRVK